MNTEIPFEKFLNQYDEEAWSATLATLLRSIHEVDRNATQIWFAFYPLSLLRALQQADGRDKLVQRLLLQGDYELRDQVDRSHKFLYGHRFWPRLRRPLGNTRTFLIKQLPPLWLIRFWPWHQVRPRPRKKTIHCLTALPRLLSRTG